MAWPRNRKRQRPDELSRSKPPAKKAKTTRESNFPPIFWDKLSKVWLTPRALRELGRRNNAHSLQESVLPKGYSTELTKLTELTRFARHGGPDLNHLRGCPDPKKAISLSVSTSQSRGTRPTAPTSVSSKPRKSSAYDNNFEQHLIDYNIYPEGYEHPPNRATPEPGNLSQTRQELLNLRASLSPSQFTESVFREFRRKNKTKSEGSMVRNVIPMIAGTNTKTPNEGNITFTNLASLTDKYTVRAVPDYFNGATTSEIHSSVKRDLYELVIPTKHVNVPVVPNFFLEAKGPNGSASVAEKQACYDGAYGARAMHALQNYQETEPAYDGNSYTYSSTYNAGTGTLQLYAHHVTAPTTTESRPEYHMTQIDGWQMTGNIDSFRRGATAFRNARDSAERYRNSFIDAANTRATQSAATRRKDVVDAGEVSSPHSQHESANCTASTAWQDADDALQQQIADGSDHALQDDVEVAGNVPGYLHGQEQTPNPSQEPADLAFDDASTGFTSSFTTFTTDPKRSRDSISPPLSCKRIHSSQGQAQGQTDLGTARRTSRSSRRATASTQSDPGGPH